MYFYGYFTLEPLSITNFDEVPILVTNSESHGLGIVYELDPYNPTDPDPNNLYWLAEENGTNIDINVAIYRVLFPPYDYYNTYGRLSTFLPY